MKSSALIRLVPVLAGALLLAAPATAPFAGPAAPAQTAPPPVLAGYWEYTTSALGQRDTETKCVRPSEINRFFGGLSTRHYQCTYPVRVVGNGNARFEGNCTSRSGRRVRVRLNGTYQPEQFTFRGGASIRAAGARIAELLLQMQEGKPVASIHELWPVELVLRESNISRTRSG